MPRIVAGTKTFIPLLPDTEGELQTWLDSYAAIADFIPSLNGFGAPDWLPREWTKHPSTLPMSSLSKMPPRLVLNTLWYPTGATRWGCGLFVVGNEHKDTNVGGACSIVVNDDLTFRNWWIVQFRELTPELSLMVVADDRYRWQYASYSQWPMDETTTWADVFTRLEIDLGVSIGFAGTDYLKPDPVEFQRHYGRAADVLEAAALSIGQRVVLNFNGSVSLQTAAVSAAEARAYRSTPTKGGRSASNPIIAGYRTRNPSVPAQVAVVYPFEQSGTAEGAGECYRIAYNATDFDYEGKTVAGADKQFTASLRAENRLKTGSPENQADLDRLACRLARDFYRWSAATLYDELRPGVETHPPIGSDDFVWWHFGSLIPDTVANESDETNGPFENLIATRYAGLPPDHEPETILAGDGRRKYLPGQAVRAKLTQALSTGGTASAVLLYVDSNGDLQEDTARPIEVVAHMEFDAAAETQLWVTAPMSDSGDFEPLGMLEGSASGDATSTTSTTTARGCAGRCKWDWNADLLVWEPGDVDECSQTSTTTAGPTSTTTAGPTTSTTTCPASDPCCGFTSTSTSTTTTSTTSTTTAPCRCQYPSFCLTDADVDACTYTFCASGEVQPPPGCPPSNSSTTTAPACNVCVFEKEAGAAYSLKTDACTGDCECDYKRADELAPGQTLGAFFETNCQQPGGGCDCGTSSTTTSPSGCTAGCHWVGTPDGWYRQSNGCGANCPCATPDTDPLICLEEDTPCVSIVIVPPGHSCTGGCIFWWIAPLERWWLTESSCAGFNIPCYCVAPSIPGTDCAPVETPCQTPTPSSTTTAPCPNCTSSSSSTTTAPACGGYCLWQGDVGEWTNLDDPCSPGCECSEPPFESEEDCERQRTPCTSTTTAGPTTSTTTAAPTTTTTTAPPTTTTTTGGPPTTTTSTTTAPCAGGCTYEWSVDGSGYHYWQILTNDCDTSNPPGTCSCVEPQFAGSILGQEEGTDCSHNCGYCEFTAEAASDPWVENFDFCDPPCGCNPPADVANSKQSRLSACE